MADGGSIKPRVIDPHKGGKLQGHILNDSGVKKKKKKPKRTDFLSFDQGMSPS